MSYLLATSTVTLICVLLHGLIVPRLDGAHRLERTHYILSLASLIVYGVGFGLGPVAFRDVYITTMSGLYAYDLLIIALCWDQLKHSYRRFYLVHHLCSFALVALWALTFETFTLAMSVAAVWMSADMWRWQQQLALLRGEAVSAKQRHTVFVLERLHRIVAYVLAAALVGSSAWLIDEVVFYSSAIVMDVIDTSFQLRALVRRIRVSSPSPAF